ncbi:ribosome maturation factor RimP [Bartonella ancashensis]|uniref:Ribosome maturation factor RimP n=1 Tax=Bartonella ancashensis TaxID=1318743 RepID=A0A0M5KWX0_9HYPH|nr:ribosome maturation factor RimP [Bartonella ancashensis]ALE03398.1 hypothetical protein PU02_0584 [Bartonella ancashensis]
MQHINEIENIDNIDEPRLLTESGVEVRIAALIEPLLKPLGYRLVRVKLSGLNGLTLQIMAERADGTMSIDDCEIVSKTVSPIMDIQNIIEQKYHLEVSSPGIDRPLVRKSDFFQWQGHIVKIETGIAIDDRRKFRGVLTNVTQNGFTLNVDKAACGKKMYIPINFSDIINAHLVLTDDLIRDALKKDKNLNNLSFSEDDFDISKPETHH